MVMDAVGEHHALGIYEESFVLRSLGVDFRGHQNGFQGMAHAKVVLAVLVPEDVSSVFGGFGKIVGVFFLAEGQVFPAGNAVAHDFEVCEGVYGIFELVLGLVFGRVLAGGQQRCGGTDENHLDEAFHRSWF